MPDSCQEITPSGPSPTNIIVLGGSYTTDRINEPGPDPSIQTPHFAAAATIEPIQYPGSKQTQANNTHNEVNANNIDGDLLIIGYSAGADSALIYADRYMREHPEEKDDWGITGIALLGPTMSGTMNEGGTLDAQWERIMNDLLAGGTNVYWLDDDTKDSPEFRSYQAPSCNGVLKKDRRPEQVHYDKKNSGLGTNDSLTFSQEVLNWFQVTP